MVMSLRDRGPEWRSAGHRISHRLTAVGLGLSVLLLMTPEVKAEEVPSLPGFASLGQVAIDKDGCASCPAIISTSKRHRTFALASDSPYPVMLSGRVEITCANGSTYHVLLQSTRRGGPFQLIPNSCVNLESKSLTVTITSVGLTPADAERTVTLIAYGNFA